MLYPFLFKPIFKERIWGGRLLERLYQKELPPEVRIGESWEIVDREVDNSVIINGPMANHNLRWLMEKYPYDLMGEAKSHHGRFPLLVKILDAQDMLSLQVHPPAKVAAALGGESKTEMWYFTHTKPEAEIYLGLRRGANRAEFERLLQEGTVAQCFHRHNVHTGDSAFVPSGRVHALGAGSVLFEIQQNSDTTYRVYDWNRTGTDGKARELHIRQALASIDFDDFDPPLIKDPLAVENHHQPHRLVDDPLFKVDVISLTRSHRLQFCLPKVQILGMVRGGLALRADEFEVVLQPGQFCLVPAQLKNYEVEAQNNTRFLRIQPE
jgi:mannose-6-phosphate isomerase